MENNKDLVQVQETQKTSWDEALEKESWVGPLVDIYETDDAFTLIADMPGVSKDDVRIKLEDGDLVIMGRIDFMDRINKRYILNETQIGNFYRKFHVADGVDDSKIDARLENGQLKIHMPKLERLKPKNIEIK
ncbi:MAG TPA: Hsp20/alpha crystallin family protein [Ignavibacteriales bacterium]|nr:Hsp20/alpha crystallin family protein [Ignavibacteriales bacterium]